MIYIIILPEERHLFSQWPDVDNLSIHLTSFRWGSHKGKDLSWTKRFQEDETKKILPSVILRIQIKLTIMKNNRYFFQLNNKYIMTVGFIKIATIWKSQHRVGNLYQSSSTGTTLSGPTWTKMLIHKTLHVTPSKH